MKWNLKEAVSYVKAIYKYKEDEYWLIVEDAYSDATMECYAAYFDLFAIYWN